MSEQRTLASQANAIPQVHSASLTPVDDTKPGTIMAHCPTPEDVHVEYLESVDRSNITSYAISVLREICSRACVPSVVISSGARSAKTQARIMYENIHNKPDGVAKALRLYGPTGKEVVHVYEKEQASGSDKAGVMAAMQRLIEQKPDQFHHVQHGKLSVFDVAPTSIREEARPRLIAEAKADPRVVKFFQPPNDPGFHFEIQNQ